MFLLTDGLLFVVRTIMQHHLIPCTGMVVRYNYGVQILLLFELYNVSSFHFNQEKVSYVPTYKFICSTYEQLESAMFMMGTLGVSEIHTNVQNVHLDQNSLPYLGSTWFAQELGVQAINLHLQIH